MMTKLFQLTVCETLPEVLEWIPVMNLKRAVSCIHRKTVANWKLSFEHLFPLTKNTEMEIKDPGSFQVRSLGSVT